MEITPWRTEEEEVFEIVIEITAWRPSTAPAYVSTSRRDLVPPITKYPRTIASEQHRARRKALARRDGATVCGEHDAAIPWPADPEIMKTRTPDRGTLCPQTRRSASAVYQHFSQTKTKQ